MQETYENELDTSSDLLAETLRIKAALDAQFSRTEIKTLEVLMPFFLEELTPRKRLFGPDKRERLTLDHVMAYLRDCKQNRTKKYDCIVKNVDAELILVAERGTRGRYGVKSQIKFLNFTGFVHACMLFRSERARLVQRLAAKCTAIMLDMQLEMREGIRQLRTEHHELQKKYWALLASQDDRVENIQ